MSEIPPNATLLTQDSPGLSTVFPPQWGIFQKNGQPLLTVDSVGSVEYTREYNVSNYPQEQGAFESYNKVQNPFDTKLTLLTSKTRQQVLNIMESLTASLALGTITTPDVSYPSANLTRYSLRRSARSGVSLIAVDVWCKEIRFTATTNVGSSATNAGASNQPVGGTQRPVGQVNGGSNLAPGSTSSNLVPGGALTGNSGNFLVPNDTPNAWLTGSSTMNTGSTNAATPTQSGPVVPYSPSASNAALANSFANGGLGGGPLTPPN